MDDIFIHELQLPMCVHATTIPDCNGDYTIMVNSLLASDVKRETILHEMVHIKKDHFYNDCMEVTAEEREAKDPNNHVKAMAYIKEIR